MPGSRGGGYGGSATAKLKRSTESQEEKEARLKARRDKDKCKNKCKTESQEEKEARLKNDMDRAREWRAALSQEDKAARNKTRRDKHKWALTVQAATHLLFALLFPQCEALLVQQKWEIDKFLDAVQAASHLAADQGKVMAIQIQFVQPDCRAIHTECRSGS